MSAYICNPEHFGVLAALAVENDCVIYQWNVASGKSVENKIANAQNVARLLARENVRSVAYRYSDSVDGERPGPCLTANEVEEAAAIYAAYFVTRPQKLKPVQALSLCAGYSYQASECDNWRMTDAELQIEWLQNALIRSLPGYADADWSFDEPVPEIEALYEKGD